MFRFATTTGDSTTSNFSACFRVFVEQRRRLLGEVVAVMEIIIA